MSTTQNGISKVLRYPPVNKTPAMMPMVFCASLVPWPRLNSAAESSCKRRKYLSTRDGAVPRKIHCIVVMKNTPSSIPMTGERTMNNSVFVQPARMITRQPAFATALPAYPPISACDELVGNPNNHVTIFQAIAPNRPAKMTFEATALMSIIPEPTVLATPTPNPNAATKLKNAAQTTAWPGESTRVETTVAIELAAS